MTIKGKYTKAKLKLLSFNWIGFVLVAGSVAIGVLYIWQVNMAATRGFAMRDLEQGIEEMEIENARLQMEVTNLRSIASVTNRMKMLGLTPVQTIEYVNPGVGSVAINR